MDDEIKVSVCCITYNQEKYIEDAIKSFLNQKTNFKYEIIIRDDASQDHTAAIIRKYEEQYPDMIHGIYEEINGREKGVHRGFNITFEKAVGKYIAICEGDDYWNCEDKLQKQYDYMEEHPECSFCFHNAVLYDEKIKKETTKFIPRYKAQIQYIKKDNNYNLGEIALLDQIPTASYFFYNSKNWPDWYFEAVVGDLPLQLVRTNDGYAHYIDEVMSVYRIGTNISMMDKFGKEKNNKEKSMDRARKYINIYENADKMSNYQYHDDFQKIIDSNIMHTIMLDPKRELNEKEKEVVKNAKTSMKIKFFFKKNFSKPYAFLKQLKNKLMK